MKKIILIILLMISPCHLVIGQEKAQRKPIPHGSSIRNGKPINLPKPPLADCDCKLDSPIQIVKVAIEIDESGNVVKAEALSGHIFYRQLAEKAALSSKYSPSILGGVRQKAYSELIYTFNFSEQRVFITDSIVKFAFFGVINAMATNLPKPEYSNEAKNLCAKGQVKIEVLVDENGNVIEVKAVSGDELLRNSSIEAVKKAKFRRRLDYEPSILKGIVIYEFPSQKKCLDVNQIVNKKAKYLPKPIYPKDCHCEGTVKVRIVIDMNGKVIFANAVLGNPIFQKSAIKATLRAKFAPTLIDGPRNLIVDYLEYVFDSNGKIKM